MADPVQELRSALADAIAAIDGAARDEPTLTRPPDPDLGHYASNVAMALAGSLGANPRQLAERLAPEVRQRLGARTAGVDVAGPGFLNLTLTDRWHREATVEILKAGEAFARPPAAEPRRVLVEFVSANPTGPLTAAGGRGAAYGDALARLLEASGNQVGREYLLNDAGGQVVRFAESIAARMRGQEPPTDGYSGDYVAEVAAELGAAGVPADDLDALSVAGTEAMRERISRTLERFGVRFDRWFSERTLHETGAVDATIDELRARGHAYDSEGAVWLRTSTFGDDKDRVLIRADGEPTYFAADVAYHRDKLARGWEHLIVPLGSDHHGYVPRMKAALEALAQRGDAYEAPMMQLVQIVEGGRRARMSKRKGQFVTLDELVDDIGVDATRFFMLQRSQDTALDLDLELARKESQENPVYYVQYAHARIASIVRKAAGEGALPRTDTGQADLDAIVALAEQPPALDTEVHPSEGMLLRRLLDFPSEVRQAAERRAPHRLCAYAGATAADFHAFYRDCQVIGVEQHTERARLGVCLVAKRVLAGTLDLIGVSAPERM